MNPQFTRYYTYIRPVFKNKTVRSYSSAAFSIVTIIIFAYFAIRPTVGTIIGLQKSIKEQSDVFDQLKSKAQNLSLGKSNFDQLDPIVKSRITSLVPNKTDLPSLLIDLSSLTNNLEASISGLQIQPVELVGLPAQLNPDSKLQEIDFTYNIQGGFSQLRELLNRLSLTNRLIAVQSINIGRSGDKGLIMTVNAKAYFVVNK